MCLAIPSIIVSDFYANKSRFIVNLLLNWFKFFSLPLQVFRLYFVVFLALGMFYFCEIPCKHLQNKNFPPSCCFHFAMDYYEQSMVEKPTINLLTTYKPTYKPTKTIRLFALNFYEMIVDSGFALINYHLVEISSS